MQRPGRMVNKEQIVDLLCQWGEEVSTNAVEVYIHRLRRKLEAGGVRITTIRGVGYCLERASAGQPTQ
jgi:two-component system OmpR family response regulator